MTLRTPTDVERRRLSPIILKIFDLLNDLDVDEAMAVLMAVAAAHVLSIEDEGDLSVDEIVSRMALQVKANIDNGRNLLTGTLQ